MSAGPMLRREKREPTEDQGRVPLLFLLFSAAVLAVGAATLLVRVPDDLAGVAGDRRTAVAPPAPMTGEAVYAANCVACHQESGLGLAGVFPPLGGSAWVVQDEKTPVRILLRGIQGPIVVAGDEYNGVMPSFGHLPDDQIAAVLTHVRSSFGNEAGPIDEALVAELRAALADDAGAWSGGAELEAARDE
ncbi:MAG: c-type cytochrome [Sandaracinaceae bacterium]